MTFMATNDDILRLLLKLTSTVDATQATIVTMRNDIRDLRDKVDALDYRLACLDNKLTAHVNDPYS